MTIPNLSAVAHIRGVSYVPVPSDDTPSPPPKYFDTDFTNSTFPLIWGGTNGDGRGDLQNLRDIGVNFLHLYDWSVPPVPGDPPGQYQRNHLPFLNYCDLAGVNCLVPISNYFVKQIHLGHGEQVKCDILKMVTEVYLSGPFPVPAAGMWGIANEFDLHDEFNVQDVVQAMVYLVQAEQTLGIEHVSTLPITSPVSFSTGGGSLPPGIEAIQTLKGAIESNADLGSKFWNGRIVASVNPFNDGPYLSNYIKNVFPKYFPKLPFFFAEMGININGQATDECQQAQFVAAQLAATQPAGNFLGRCVFQFLDQSALKTGPEATFGMTKYRSDGKHGEGKIPNGYVPGGGESYPIDWLTYKPLYKAVKKAYNG